MIVYASSGWALLEEGYDLCSEEVVQSFCREQGGHTLNSSLAASEHIASAMRASNPMM